MLHEKIFMTLGLSCPAGPGRNRPTLVQRLCACGLGGAIALGSAPALSAAVSYPLVFGAGWTLAGNSLTQPLDVKATLGPQTSIQTVWKWDAGANQWSFYAPSLDAAGTLASYAASKGYSVLSSINPGEGFWVNATSATSLAAQSGTGHSLAASHLKTGWNLGATGDHVTPAELSTAMGNITTLWAWSNTNGAWFFHAPSLAASNTLAEYVASKGYKDFGALTLDNGLGFWINYAGTASAGPGSAPVTFTARTRPAGASRAPAKLVWTGTRFVGLEQSTDFHNTSAKLTSWTSADGVAWSRQPINVPNDGVNLFTANGKVFKLPGAYAANPFTIYTSDDALTWTSSTASYTGFAVPMGVKYLNGRYFVSLDHTTCAAISSTDTTTWTTTALDTLPLPSNYYKNSNSSNCSEPFYVGGKYRIYGGTIQFFDTKDPNPPAQGLMYTSTDGVTWGVETFALPAGANSIVQGGRASIVFQLGNTIVLPQVQQISTRRINPTDQYATQVIDSDKVGTSTDGITFTYAERTGLAEVKGTISTYYPDFVVSGAMLGLTNVYAAGATVPTSKYFWTANGSTYTPAPDFGLFKANNTVIQAYSPALRRLVRMTSLNGGAPTIDTYDFPGTN